MVFAPNLAVQLRPARWLRASNRRHRGGVAMIFTVVSLTLFTALASLAVDYGHVQLVKMEMQRNADVTARGYLDTYLKDQPSMGTLGALSYAYSIAQSYLCTQSYNPVDLNSGATPTVVVTPGTWNTTSRTFTANATLYNATNVIAVQVTAFRNTAHGNPVPLFWGQVFGRKWCDTHAMSTGALLYAGSGNVSVSANSDLYFSGMPAGTTDSYGDNMTQNAPTQANCITVVPGTYITFTNNVGTSSVVPGYVPLTGPNGDSADVVHHGQNWDSNPNPGGPNPENGIADAKMPEDSFVGLFLTGAAPNATAAPTTEVDWSNSTQANLPSYTNLALKTPFKIGNGYNSSGVVQTFLVPPGATRMFLGLWDGLDYQNNSGTISGTVSVKAKASIVLTD